MDFLDIVFPVSGVETNILIPPVVALLISFFTSMGGVSGAFLLLPFQMSVLGYTAPSVSGTNHVFNVVAIPSGVYRYSREGRMLWPLTWALVVGTVPGIFLGYHLRLFYLPDPRIFKLFVGCVLLYMGVSLFWDVAKRTATIAAEVEIPNPYMSVHAAVKTVSVTLQNVEYEFGGKRFSFHPLGMSAVSFFVGIIGGAYGIGGGSFLAPFSVLFFGLPLSTIAGAILMQTFVASVTGALFYSIIPIASGVLARPDWPLGILFGFGGLIGMYAGARFQKFVPQRFIKLMLGVVILFLALRYIASYF